MPQRSHAWTIPAGHSGPPFWPPEQHGRRAAHGRASPGQRVQHGLQLLAHEPHEPVLDVAVGDVEHEDEGGRAGRLTLLQGSRPHTWASSPSTRISRRVKVLARALVSHLGQKVCGTESPPRTRSLMLRKGKSCLSSRVWPGSQKWPHGTVNLTWNNKRKVKLTKSSSKCRHFPWFPAC